MNILLPRHLELEPYISFRESETTLVVVTEVSVEIAGDRLSLSLTALVTLLHTFGIEVCRLYQLERHALSGVNLKETGP